MAEGPTAYDETDPVPAAGGAANSSPASATASILLTTKDGRLVCIAPGHQDEVLTYFAKQAYAATDGGHVAIGRPRPGATGIVHSYEEALNTLELAERMGLDEPVLRAAELLVFPVLARDRQALVDLVLYTLGPLEEARGGAGPCSTPCPRTSTPAVWRPRPRGSCR